MTTDQPNPLPPARPEPDEDAAALRARVEALERANADLEKTVALQDLRVTCIQEISATLGSTLSLDETLNIIMEKVTILMDADRSTLFLIDRDANALWSKVIQGDQINEIRLQVGEGIAGWVAETGQSINIKDAYRDRRFNSDVDLRTGYQTRSILCQPIRNNTRQIIGVIQVLNSRRGSFTTEDENLLSALASQAAVVVENSMLYLSMVDKNLELTETQIKLKKKIAEVDLLYTIQRELAGARDLPDLAHAVARKTLEIIPAQLCAVGVVENDHLRMFTLDTTRPGASAADLPMDIRRVTRARGVIGSVVGSGQQARLNAAAEASAAVGPAIALIAPAIQVQHVIAVPFFAQDRCIGAIKLINRLDQPYGPVVAEGFSDDDVKLLSLLGGQIDGAIDATISREREEKANRLATIGQMLSSVIHDFKTPVTIISGYVQLMTRQDDAALRKEYAEAVLSQFDQLNKMTRELLAFARGESTVLLRKVFMHKFAAELDELLRRDLGSHGIELTMDVRYRKAAKMDDAKLKRAIFNLARNAADAMPNGGAFEITIDSDGDDVLMAFADTGSGIPESIQDALFDSFVTQGKAEGTGLGLAIVKKIVEEHNGTITFTTKAGVGTTFVIRFPLDQETPRTAPAPSNANTAATATTSQAA